MTLDVETPPPPTLSDAVDPSAYEDTEVGGQEYHREDLERFLKASAWERSFAAWASDTNMDERAFAIARDLGLFEQYDFFWDSFAQRVGYHTPGVPEDWRERELHSDLDSWETVSTINATLAELGNEVATLLGEEYVDWDDEYEAPDDLPEF